jgi:hypothetical protein
VTAPIYHKKLERALDYQGGLYALTDILERISDGRMQSWVQGIAGRSRRSRFIHVEGCSEIVAAVGDRRLPDFA